MMILIFAIFFLNFFLSFKNMLRLLSLSRTWLLLCSNSYISSVSHGRDDFICSCELETETTEEMTYSRSLRVFSASNKNDLFKIRLYSITSLSLFTSGFYGLWYERFLFFVFLDATFSITRTALWSENISSKLQTSASIISKSESTII